MMNYRLFTWGLTSLLLFLPLQALGQNIRTPDEPSALASSFWSLSIQDADSGKELVGIRSHHLTTPASTLKLVSSATLWSKMGSGKRIPTEVYTDSTISGGVLQGNLYIVGYGDPSIGSRYFWNSDQDRFFKEVAKGLRAKGITRVTGDVIALSTPSDFQANNPRWLAYDMGNAYAPGIWSLNAYDNSYSLHFTAYGKSYGVEPPVPQLRLQKAYSISPTQRRDSLYISPFVGADGSYPITGVYPGRVEKLRIRGAIPHPPLFVAERLRSLLPSEGITLLGQSKVASELPPTGRLLYTYYSPKLHDIIKTTLVYSHNLFAEGLLRLITFGQSGAPGHNATQTAIEEVKNYWQGRGLDTRELEMFDGSGLSPENRVTAYFLASMLGKVHRADPSGSYMRLLPRAGLDGTLTIFLKGTPLQGHAYLKSGTLRNVICYAGYVQQGGKTYTIALMVNNYYGKASATRKAMETLLLQAFGY